MHPLRLIHVILWFGSVRARAVVSYPPGVTSYLVSTTVVQTNSIPNASRDRGAEHCASEEVEVASTQADRLALAPICISVGFLEMVVFGYPRALALPTHGLGREVSA